MRVSWDDVERWTSLLRSMPIAVIATDATGTVVLWNDHASLMYGYPTEEALDRPIQSLTVGPQDQQLADSIISRVASGGVWEGEFSAARRDGSMIDIHVIDAPILDEAGAIVGIVGLSVDVTQSRNELRTYLDQVRSASLKSLVGADFERSRIALELHDDLGQTLTAMRSELHWLRERPAAEHAEIIDRLQLLVDHGIDSVKRVCEDLRPRLMFELGLENGIDIMTRQCTYRVGATADIDLQPIPMLTPSASTALFRVAQECLTNIERHASDSTTVTVRLFAAERSAHLGEAVIVLQVSSNGGNYSGEVGFGVSSMRTRIDALGGVLNLDVGLEGGLAVTAEIPVRYAKAPEPPPGETWGWAGASSVRT